MELQITITDKARNFNNYVSIIQRKDSGEESEYEMTLTEIIRLLESAQVEIGMAPSPYLPRNCFKFLRGSGGLSYEVFVDIPKQQWNISFNNNPFTVGFPRMIFQWGATKNSMDNKNKWQVRLNSIYAVKGTRRIDKDTPLFHFPYSHVNDSGNVCMGGNQFPEIDCLSGLETLHSIFLLSPFSHDYGAKTTLKKPCWELFSTEFNQKDFNDEVLVSINKSFGTRFNIIED
ncbi:hypothetical protein ACFSCX_06745 [Bacillus salitolerans]|uniref:PRTRC system protein B n=1 Tax=Bacillus salitolerans TaxID=1437434 RepID=A0ABW4LM51_9BACI